MALGCLRLVLRHAVTGGYRSTSPVTLLLLYKPQSNRTKWGLKLQQWTVFSTAVGDSEDPVESDSQEKKKKKKQDPRARVTISSVGRKIHQRHLLLLNEQGENMGTMHRADALRIMDERGLKLVPVNEHADPPVFRLMSGKQIHEEQMKLREKQKAKPSGPVQVKDLTLSSDIALHDLDTKLKQVANWLEKKHHIRLTLKAGRNSNEQALETVLEEMVSRLTVLFGFVSKPRLIREGQAASCVLRPPSAKELQQAARHAAQTPTKPPPSEPEQQNPSTATSKPDEEPPPQ